MANQTDRPRPVRVVAVDHRDEDLLPVYGEVFRRFGLELRPVADLEAWVAARPTSLIVLKITDTDDWRRLEQLSRNGGTVVAVLAETAPSFYRRAVMTGASGVAAATDAPTHVARVVQAAIAHYALLPVTALRESDDVSRGPMLSDANKALLVGLAQGFTAEQLATQQGCSERTIYRQVRRLCAKLQVRSRDEAVTVARNLGLLDAALAQRDG